VAAARALSGERAMNVLSGDPPRGRALQILLILIILALAAAPFLFPGARALNVASKICVMILLVASYDLLLGYTGIVSFAHVMFFGVGAYGVGLALYGMGASWGALALGLVAALALSLALALAIGLFSLRVQSISFAMVTLAVAYAFNVLASQLSWLTGGEDGRSFKVPEVLQPGFRLVEGKVFGVALNGRLITYYLVLVVVAAAFLVLLRIVNSPFGRVLQAIRENPFRAEALGYRTVFHRTLATCISASGATLAGALSALWLRYVGPDTALSFSIQVDVLVMVVVGGMGSLYGAILGAALFVFAESYLQAVMGALSQAAAEASLPILPALSIPTAGSCGSASPLCLRSISPRPGSSGRSSPAGRRRTNRRRAWAHRSSEPPGRYGGDRRFEAKACPFVGAPGAKIVDRRIDRDERRPFGAEALSEQTQIRRPMAVPDHRRRPDEAVDRPRPSGQKHEMRLRPGVDLVVLRIGERPASKGDDAHCHVRLVQVRAQEFKLFAWISPPARDLGRAEPAAKPRQVVSRREAKGIGREHRRGSLSRERSGRSCRRFDPAIFTLPISAEKENRHENRRHRLRHCRADSRRGFLEARARGRDRHA